MLNNNKAVTNSVIEQRFNVLRTAMAVGISLVLAFILIATVSPNPGRDMFNFLFGPLTTGARMANMVEKMIPLLFTGVAVCLMYAAGQINLAAEGAFFAGAYMCTPIAIMAGIPMGIHPVLCIIVGGLAGAVMTGIPAFMHVKFGVLTVVSSLMINYVSLYLGLYLILNFFRDPAAGYEASFKFANSALLPAIVPKTNIHVGLIIGIFVVIFGYVLLYKSTFGYSIRMIGQNQKFAQYSGVKVGSVIILAQLAAGFIAGMGGSIEVLGMYKRFGYSGFTNHGWDGIMIAVLARNNPKYVPFAVLFLSYIRTAADVLNKTSTVPIEVVKIIQAVVIIFVAAESFLSGWEHKSIVKNSQKLAQEAAGLAASKEA